MLTYNVKKQLYSHWSQDLLYWPYDDEYRWKDGYWL